MSYGLIVRDELNNVILNDSSDVFIFVDLFSIASGSSGFRDYPAYIGSTIQANQVQQSAFGTAYADIVNFSVTNLSVSYPSGTPRVSWAPVSGTTASTILILVVAN